MSSKKEKLLESAQKYILKGQFDRAIKDYEQVLALEPGDVRQRQRLAELLVRIDRKADAIKEYESIGKYYADNSFYLKAIAVNKQIQKLNPQDFTISLTIASLNEKQGLVGDALAEYSRVYGHYERIGKRTEALAVLKSMLTLDPENLNTRLKFAESRFATGSVDAAYQEFFTLALLLHSRGDLSACKQVCERVKLLYPENSTFFTDLLAARVKAGDTASVIPALQEITRVDSRNLAACTALIGSLKASGGGESLKVGLQEAIRLFPEEMGLKESLLEYTLEMGDTQALSRLLKLHAPSFIANGASKVLEQFYLQVAERLPEQTGLLQELRGYCATLPPQSAQAAKETPPAAVSAGPKTVKAPVNETSPAPVEPPVHDLELSLEYDGPLLPQEVPSRMLTSGEGSSSPAEQPDGCEIELDLSDDFNDEFEPGGWDTPSFAGEPNEMVQEPEQGSPTFPEDIVMDLDFAELDMEMMGEEPADLPSDNSTIAAAPVELPEGPDDIDSPIAPGLEISDVDVDLELDQSEDDGKDDFLEQFNKEDTESHYNLGIAYKEMGMYDNAIAELQAASVDPERKLDCIILQGMCCRDKGDVVQAEEMLKKGLAFADSRLSRKDAVPLEYELALLYEASGRMDEALSAYQRVKAVAGGFRDTFAKIAGLQGEAVPAPYDLDCLEEIDVLELQGEG